jgi:hypothetical protein
MATQEDNALAEIQYVMQGTNWSLHATYAFGIGVGVQVKDRTRKIGPIIFPSETQTLADVLSMLGDMAAREDGK